MSYSGYFMWKKGLGNRMVFSEKEGNLMGGWHG